MFKSGDVASVSIFKMPCSFGRLCLTYLGYVYISGFFHIIKLYAGPSEEMSILLGSGPRAKAKALICLIVREIN